MKKTTLIIADENQNFLDEMVKNFTDDKFEVLATTTNGDELVKLVNDLRPSMVIMDVVLQQSDGFKVMEEIGKNTETSFVIQSSLSLDGFTGFLFLDKSEMPMVALHWEHYFKHIRTKYNKIYRIQLPKITPHVCRHTFCSNMAKSGMNPKTLQYIMGHSDIGITLDTYTHLKIEDAQEEFDRCLEA